MRLLLDPKNEELADILNTLLTDNIDITPEGHPNCPTCGQSNCSTLAMVN